MDALAVKQYAKDRGADLIGIAPAERFNDAPADASPLSIFPECRSVVVIGRRILRGSLRGVEEGTNFSSTYRLFGYTWLEDNFLSRTTYELNLYIEENGYEGVPLFGYHPEGMPKGMPVTPGQPAPNVIVDPYIAARAAGLGVIGKGGFFITPQYGTRQRFAMLLTDAELESDPIVSADLCAGCDVCVAVCPFKAITQDAVDYSVCAKCPNGAALAPGRGSRPDRIAAACGRACLVHLETSGQCANTFRQEFRKREPWVTDLFNRPARQEVIA